MTGFGRASSVAAGKRITVELKSLNSKQLDLNVRMPSIFRELEIELRHTVLAELERGKVELTVSVETLGPPQHCRARRLPPPDCSRIGRAGYP